MMKTPQQMAMEKLMLMRSIDPQMRAQPMGMPHTGPGMAQKATPKPMGAPQKPMTSQKKTPWAQQNVFGGFNRGDLLLASMGMLSGRDLGEGFAYASGPLGSAIDRNAAKAEEDQRRAELTKAMGLMQGGEPKKAQEVIAGVYPDAMGEALVGQMFAPKGPEYGFMNVDGQVIRTDTRGGGITEMTQKPDEPVKPASPLGKIMTDVANNIITQEQADAEIARLAQRGDSSAQNVQSTFVDENGQLNLVYRNGTIQGSGMQVQNPFQITDVGGVPTAINRRTGEGISISTPQEVGTNKATVETIVGNEADRREAQKDLPAARLKLDQSIATINQLIDHPGFDSRYGLRSVIPAIPGTPGADAQAFIDQIGGQAFLQAFETLKGGGQITEIEGNKATQALIRAQKQGITPDEARKAYKEFIYWANKGYEMAQAQASGSYAPQGADAPPLKFNPDTGDFE